MRDGRGDRKDRSSDKQYGCGDRKDRGSYDEANSGSGV